MSILRKLPEFVGQKDIANNITTSDKELLRSFEPDLDQLKELFKSKCIAIKISIAVLDDHLDLILRGINRTGEILNYQRTKIRASNGRTIDSETARQGVSSFKAAFNSRKIQSFVDGFIVWTDTIQNAPPDDAKLKFSLFKTAENVFYMKINISDAILLIKSASNTVMRSDLPCPPFCSSIDPD